MKEVVIVGGCRTAIGAYGGTLKSTPVVELGATVMKGTLKKLGLRPVTSAERYADEPDKLKGLGMLELEQRFHDYDKNAKPVEIDYVYLGNVLTAGLGQNTARQAMIRAGIPKETPATTVNKLCASGMEAVALATQAIRSGDAEVVMAGGMENMSMVPYALPGMRWGQRMGNAEAIDLMVFDGLFEGFYGYHMGITAENIAAKYGITRQEQDEMGALSHKRAMAAIASGVFKDEIVPVMVPQRKGDPVPYEIDERPMDTSAEKMGKLKPAFKKDGTVTAGNASGLNDAAASLLMMSAEKAKELGLKPLARIKAISSAGLDPAYMGLGPIPAVRKLMRQQGLKISDFGRIELNEAFASQAIACVRELNCDMEKTNVLGSGISLGHPIGCTGARILLTLMNAMQRDNLALGLASLCIGGGQGMAIVLEKV
ncbi:MAG: acetyl-CoA C-acetyltransferase [Desulfobulbaceae bacterium]|nr:acetyl-CoA C-acetyltransferase [Desulfobulbaceae bacterium]